VLHSSTIKEYTTNKIKKNKDLRAGGVDLLGDVMTFLGKATGQTEADEPRNNVRNVERRK
jgi:hypothetical protein